VPDKSVIDLLQSMFYFLFSFPAASAVNS
jgi:hypothetical protein